MDGVSIILTTRQTTGSNDVEIIGECEKTYKPLALYAFSSDVIRLAKESEGWLLPWVKERGMQQFCMAFRFKTEEKKKEFLNKLSNLA